MMMMIIQDEELLMIIGKFIVYSNISILLYSTGKKKASGMNSNDNQWFRLKLVQDGYYKCVREFTPKNLTTQIEASYNIETDIGRGRAWFFLALNDNLTESYIRCFQDHRKLVKQFYTTDSLVNDAEVRISNR